MNMQTIERILELIKETEMDSTLKNGETITISRKDAPVYNRLEWAMSYHHIDPKNLDELPAELQRRMPDGWRMDWIHWWADAQDNATSDSYTLYIMWWREKPES